MRFKKMGDGETSAVNKPGLCVVARFLAATALLAFLGSVHAAYPEPFATMHLDVSPGNIRTFKTRLSDADDDGGIGVGMWLI